MAKKTKTKQITITEDRGTFSAFFRRFSGEKDDYNFESIASVRNLLSNEKARIMHLLKTKQPKSIYELSRMLKRDFKSVSDDIKLLEKFGFIDLIKEKTGNRARLKPVTVVDSINIEINV